MTQALLNEMNNVFDGIYSVGNSIGSDVTEKFHEILDSKSFEKVSNITKKVEQTAIHSDASYACMQNTNKTNDSIQSFEISETENSNESDNFDDIISEATSESLIEESLTDEEEELMLDELIPENNTTTTTITEEDTTMHKELALENPTVTAMLFNLQIDQSNSNLDGNEIQTLSGNTLVSENDTVLDAESKLFDDVKIAFDREYFKTQDEQNNLDNIVDKQILDDLNVESVSSQSSGNGSDLGNFMQNSSPQEQITKMMIQGENFAELKPETSFSVASKPEISSDKILEQITKQLEGMYNTSKLNIVLNPESLGRVSLQLLNSKAGLSAQFVVTNEDVRALLMKGLDGLKETLLSHGVNVDNVTIKLNEAEMKNEDTREDWTEQEGSRGGNKQQGSKRQRQEEKPFEQTMFEINNTEV